MPQFDVLRTRNATVYPLVVDIQADLHARLTTRLVVPMIPRARYTQPTTRLHPVIRLRSDDYVVVFPLLSAVPRSALGEIVGSLTQQRATLIEALDLLITGS